jgi:hypothetical protein
MYFKKNKFFPIRAKFLHILSLKFSKINDQKPEIILLITYQSKKKNYV